MTRTAAVVAMVLLLLTTCPPVRPTSGASPSQAIWEGLGPSLNSTALAESSSFIFQGDGEILLTAYDELTLPIESGQWTSSVASFGAPGWSDLRWITRDRFSPMQDGFSLFSSTYFNIRYSQQAYHKYVSVNDSCPILRQNFTVPSSLNGFEAGYAWVVVRVASGSTSFHCELEDYGSPQTIQTAGVNVTGPYDWWVTLKLNSSMTLVTGAQLSLGVVWEAGTGASILLIDDALAPQDCASGPVSLFNSSSLAWVRLDGWMMMSSMTGPPQVNQLTLVVPQWRSRVQLGTYKLLLHGRNLPQGILILTVDSVVFGYGFTPAVFTSQPLSEAEFEVSVLGSGGFSGGTIGLSSNLGTVEQSRTHYDANNLPPFFRPFSRLTAYTDASGKPWGEWSVSSSGWRVQVKDERWIWHDLPASDIVEEPYAGRITYRLRIFSPVPPNVGFFSYVFNFTWRYDLLQEGPVFLSHYSVFHSHTAWTVRSNRVNITAPPLSTLKFIIGGLPEDWAVSDFHVSPGPGGGTPFARMVNASLELGGIVMGQSTRYSGDISVDVESSNYFQTVYSRVLVIRGGTSASYFLLNDTAMLQAKAASALGVVPPGDVTLEVLGPAGNEVYSAVIAQSAGGSVSAGPLMFLQVGVHRILAKFKSSEGLRVGAKSMEVTVVRFQVNISKQAVRLSDPSIRFELIPSDMRSVGLAWVNMTSSSGVSRRVGLSVGNASAISSFEFNVNDPREVTDWSAQFWVSFPDGSDRLVETAQFSVIDDIPPDVVNVTILPTRPTLLDDVSVTFTASDRGSGLNRTWVSYSTWSGQETELEANLGADGRFTATIPKQLPFVQVTVWVRAMDRSGNIFVYGPTAYQVGVPPWVSMLLLILVVAAVVIYMKRTGKA